jgi:hypothetical protein
MAAPSARETAIERPIFCARKCLAARLARVSPAESQRSAHSALELQGWTRDRFFRWPSFSRGRDCGDRGPIALKRLGDVLGGLAQNEPRPRPGALSGVSFFSSWPCSQDASQGPTAAESAFRRGRGEEPKRKAFAVGPATTSETPIFALAERARAPVWACCWNAPGSAAAVRPKYCNHRETSSVPGGASSGQPCDHDASSRR